MNTTPYHPAIDRPHKSANKTGLRTWLNQFENISKCKVDLTSPRTPLLIAKFEDGFDARTTFNLVTKGN